MPLNFDSSIPPTLGKKRSVREVQAEVREKFPISSIIYGLRNQGGFSSTRSAEQQRRIEHYKLKMREEELRPKKSPEWTPDQLLPGWSWPTEREIEVIAKAAMKGEWVEVRRSMKPESFKVETDQARYGASIIARSKNGPDRSDTFSRVLISYEELQRAQFPLQLVALTLQRQTMELVELEKKAKYANVAIPQW